MEYLDQAQYELAIKSFKDGVESPNFSMETRVLIYRNIAQTYYEMMEIDSSLLYSQLAADCYPIDSYGYLTNISDIKISTGETEEAEKPLLKAVKMKPNKLVANNILDAIYLGEFGAEFFDPEKAFPYNIKAFKSIMIELQKKCCEEITSNWVIMIKQGHTIQSYIKNTLTLKFLPIN